MDRDPFERGAAVIYTTPTPSQEIYATYQERCYRGPRFDRHAISWRDDKGRIVRRYVSVYALRDADQPGASHE